MEIFGLTARPETRALMLQKILKTAKTQLFEGTTIIGFVKAAHNLPTESSADSKAYCDIEVAVYRRRVQGDLPRCAVNA
jgi:hypothetical protein